MGKIDNYVECAYKDNKGTFTIYCYFDHDLMLITGLKYKDKIRLQRNEYYHVLTKYVWSFYEGTELNFPINLKG